jgi:hypothetical protein
MSTVRTKLRGITVAGLRIAIEAPPSLPWHWPEGAVARFASSAVDADVHVGVRVGEVETQPGEAVCQDSDGGTVEMTRDGRDFVIASHIRGVLQRVARFDDGFRWGEVVIGPESSYARSCGYPLAHPLDELILRHRIVREGGLMLRACGVLREGHALLFAGPSGAGKTTISQLMRTHADALVLSDDRVVLRRDGGGTRVFATPWHGDGKLDSTLSARLCAIHVIRHAPEVLAEPLCGATAACALLENALLPGWDPAGSEAALDFVAGLVQRVPVVRLGFPKDERVVRYAWGPGSVAATERRSRGPERHAALTPTPSAA